MKIENSPFSICNAAADREDPAYLTRQLITYIGNKRALLAPIGAAVQQVQARLVRSKLRILDAFAGSGVVSRFFKQHAASLTSNDLEDYAAAAARCHLRNRGEVDDTQIARRVEQMNAAVDHAPLPAGFIEELYAPRDEDRVSADDRVFYTRRNARRLDNYRRMLDALEPGERELLLGPLLSQASIHANTAGVFKGFYKDRRTGVGSFGGSGGDALRRIKGDIRLEPPLLSRHECEVIVRQQDANELVRGGEAFDLAYFDPPYNQHPYGSNYFMLNLVTNYQRPAKVSRVSGIPTDWRRSAYNRRNSALKRFRQLVHDTNARFLLVSFNDEGFIAPAQMHDLLREIGRVEVMETRYNTFRGSRNLRGRSIHVTEQLFLVER